MFITLFVESSDKQAVVKFSMNFLDLAKHYTIKASITHLESYWKIDNMHKVHIEGAKPNEKQLKGFLNQIASKWLKYPNEFLASKTMEDCKIHLEDLNMITIEFDE